jgi:hypothetical protein
MKILKHRSMSVREYTEFYKVNIRNGYVEDTLEKVARYINGLRLDIKDEIGLLYLRTIEDAFQFALKVEKVARYINGLRLDIKDEIGLLSLRTIEDAFQFALKVEEKMTRKKNQQGRGRGSFKGRG